jgi:hypothetical protein
MGPTTSMHLAKNWVPCPCNVGGSSAVVRGWQFSMPFVIPTVCAACSYGD